jgi:hypothetical protein
MITNLNNDNKLLKQLEMAFGGNEKAWKPNWYPKQLNSLKIEYITKFPKLDRYYKYLNQFPS